MNNLFMIVRSNMKKSKGQTVAIIVLILISAIMLNLWLMLSMDYKANFNRYHDKLNAEHVTVSVGDNSEEFKNYLSNMLSNDNSVAEFRLDDCLHQTGSFSYNNGTMSCWFAFLDKQTATSRSIGRVEIVEEGSFSSGVYLPMIYKSNAMDIGKSVEISIGSNKVNYTICGFFNSIMMGSHNCTITNLVLTEDKYNELSMLGIAQKATLCSVRLNNKADNQSFEAYLKNEILTRFNDIYLVSNSYDIVSSARYISQMIISGILSAMAFFVLLIALVVIASNLINYIQVNMKKLGALKAVGYTSKQIIFTLLLQFIGISLVASILGILLSYLLFPAINSMMISQTGIPYTLRFLPKPIILVLVILCGTVALVVWLASRQIKNIEPIVALRSGVQTHNFKKNYIPLEKTKAPLNFALALKTTFSGLKHNITICITMLMLSLVVVFTGLMTRNIIVDMTPFVNLIVGETADSCISIKTDIENEFISEMKKDNRVEKIYLYTSINVSHANGSELVATICDDFSQTNNQDVVFEGRFPKYDNEIAVGIKYAKQKGIALGSEIEILANGKKEKFLVAGFTQISNNLGKDCLLTKAGYERFGELLDLNYYINLSDSTDIDNFNDEMKQKYSQNINSTINIVTILEGSAGVYISLMVAVVIVILVFSIIIIAFVLYLLVRTMLNNKLRDYGILKSLGFTTRQLVLQTALSFMPAIVISTIIGITLSSFAINPLMGLFLSGIGIVKCNFIVPVTFNIIAGLGLILLSFGIACLMSLKIKKIEPRKLLLGE